MRAALHEKQRHLLVDAVVLGGYGIGRLLGRAKRGRVHVLDEVRVVGLIGPQNLLLFPRSDPFGFDVLIPSMRSVRGTYVSTEIVFCVPMQSISVSRRK